MYESNMYDEVPIKEMDNIDDLPVNKDEVLSSEEKHILQKYFNVDKSKKVVRRGDIKEVVYTTLIFLLVANPLFDKMLDYLPHMGSPLIKWVFKIMLFFILYYVTMIIIR